MVASALALLLATGCGAGVDVRGNRDESLELEAKGAPISKVLECLSEKAGFKLVIEPGTSLRQPLNISLQRGTSTQLVNAVLEGLAVNYAFTTDPATSRVVTLLVVGRSNSLSTSGPPTSAIPGSLPPRRPPTDVPTPEPEIQTLEENPPLPPPSHLMPFPLPLYPEARPLSPLSLRDARQIRAEASRQR